MLIHTECTRHGWTQTGILNEVNDERNVLTQYVSTRDTHQVAALTASQRLKLDCLTNCTRVLTHCADTNKQNFTLS